MHTSLARVLSVSAVVAATLTGLTGLTGMSASDASPRDPSAERPSPNAYATDGERSPGVSSMACSYVPSTGDISAMRTAYTIAYDRKVSAKLMLAMFEAGWVESHWNNLTCGDRDSVGLFQFRPSMGWGTYAQCTDVVYQANKWVTVALPKERYAATSGALAQSVEVSAYPNAYDNAEATARNLMAQTIAPYGPIGTLWKSLGSNASLVGAPLAPQRAAAVPGQVQDFSHGIILFDSSVGAHSVRGAIRAQYAATGGVARWGFPLGEEAPGQLSPAGSRGQVQNFQKAKVLWSAKTQTHVVHGAIGAKFAQVGAEKVLGYPQTEEVTDSTGSITQTFQSGMLRWTAKTGVTVTYR